MAGTSHGILVGYDGSQRSLQALNWAIRAAQKRGVTVTVCHAWLPVGARPLDTTDFELHRRIGERVLAEATRHLWTLGGPTAVARPELIPGPAATVLCEQSAGAEMVVVGARGRGTRAGLLVGSVSMQVAAHGHGRVIVVRGPWWPPYGYAPGVILVGADGSAGCDAAVNFAFEEAQLHAAQVLAICSRSCLPGVRGSAEIEAGFEQQIARAQKEHPGVDVTRQLAGGTPSNELLTAAVYAQLLVVGPHGGSGTRETGLGSVARAVLRHASCPVGVIRSPDRGLEGSVD